MLFSCKNCLYFVGGMDTERRDIRKFDMNRIAKEFSFWTEHGTVDRHQHPIICQYPRFLRVSIPPRQMCVKVCVLIVRNILQGRAIMLFLLYCVHVQLRTECILSEEGKVSNRDVGLLVD